MLTEFAKSELALVGPVYDGMVNEAVQELVDKFAGQGHSGGSASLTLEMTGRLMRFKPLTPLTGEDDEWNEVGNGVLQNKRCPTVFRENGRPHDISLPRAEGTDQWTEITFPYEVL